jgi:cell division protein FtsW (lipid II flippase)
METHTGFFRTPRSIGVACACAATGLGLVYLAAASAPAAHLAVNVLSLVVGLAFYTLMQLSGMMARIGGGVAIALGGLLLLATALFGVPVEGASRWIRIGGLSLQVSLIVLPAMLVAFARGRDLLATIGVVLAAIALALQPDRAMAGVLVAGLGVLGVYRRDRHVVSALLLAVVGFTVTLFRPDSLPAVPYVDQILYSAFEVHPLAGIAVVGGSLLLLVPAIVGHRLDPENRDGYAVFGAIWLSMLAAAAIGNYPTPLVGYGGSAILGYAFSLSFMPRMGRSESSVRVSTEDAAQNDLDKCSDLRVELCTG